MLEYTDDTKKKKVRAKTAGQRVRKTVQSYSFLNGGDQNIKLNESGYVSTKRISGPLLKNSDSFVVAPKATVSISNKRLKFGR